MLSDFIAAIQETMIARGVLASDAVIGIGAEHTAENDLLALWVVPKKDTWTQNPPPSARLDTKAAPDPNQYDVIRNQRWLRTREVTFEVHIWAAGDDPDQWANLDAAVHNFLSSCFIAAEGAFRLGDGAYVDTTLVNRFGREYVLRMVLEVPLTAGVVTATAGTTANAPTSAYAPDGTATAPSDFLIVPGGSGPEKACGS